MAEEGAQTYGSWPAHWWIAQGGRAETIQLPAYPSVLIATAGRKQKGWEPRGAHPLHNVVAMLLCLLGHPVAAKDAAQTEADLCIVFLRRRCIR
jgi:hypothetical protein